MEAVLEEKMNNFEISFTKYLLESNPLHCFIAGVIMLVHMKFVFYPWLNLKFVYADSAVLFIICWIGFHFICILELSLFRTGPQKLKLSNDIVDSKNLPPNTFIDIEKLNCNTETNDNNTNDSNENSNENSSIDRISTSNDNTSATMHKSDFTQVNVD